jgi:hypothetical protein
VITAAPINERIAGMPAANAATLQQLLVRCRVKVNGTTYTALFPSTFDAINDAQERFGVDARISAQRAAA